MTPTTLVRKLGWRLEVVLVVAGYELYSLLQALTTGHARAYSHAHELVHAERVMHLWVEPRVSHLGVVHPLLALTGGYYYELTHVGVTALVLIYLWRRHRDIYATLRSSLILISLPALVIYAAWPVAPPRLSAGVPDTLVQHNVLDAAHVHNGIVNLYAAMPSLHVAWAVWCAAAVAYSSRRHWRHLAWGYPAATTFVVLLTGNHFLLDAVAGALLAAAVLLTYTRISLRKVRVVGATPHAASWKTRREPALSR